ncbi:cysteine synthase A [Desulfogranum mediterraneum]|uniref:cysteine synthase A n=1 Tax=Desulfogranum mediterraneum TaxID=160661 RepID=UPI0003F50639|nr:cysteine synthase A [Desulfogranum mediterraneum]
MKPSYYSDISQAVGATPLVRLGHYAGTGGVEFFAKLEAANPLGSVKDRVALAMISDAETAGLLKASTLIVEPTSGNTGIGLAFLCASRGYRLILTMPESMSVERRALLRHLGAELVLTPAAEGMQGAIAQAEELCAQAGDAWMPNQFANPSNPAMHRRTTGPEIWSQLGEEVDILVAGVGTGGTVTGAGGFLKEQNPNLLVIAVEPAASAVLSGGAAGPHKIQGIGAGFVPAILDRSLIDEVVQVENEAAIATAREIARLEGILCGISCGAAMAGALEIASRSEHAGKRVVVVFPDTGERYLSTDLMA